MIVSAPGTAPQDPQAPQNNKNYNDECQINLKSHKVCNVTILKCHRIGNLKSHKI